MKRAITTGEMKAGMISMEEQRKIRRNHKLFLSRYKKVFEAIHESYYSPSYLHIGNLLSHEAKQSFVDDIRSRFLEEQLKSTNDIQNFFGAIKINIMISSPNNLRFHRIIEFGLNGHLKNLLAHRVPTIRLEAARALYRIIHEGTAEHADKVLKDIVSSQNYVPALLSDREHPLQFQMGVLIVCTAANLDSKYRDSLLHQGVMLPLAAWVESYTDPLEANNELLLHLLHDTAGAIRYLCSGDPPPSLDQIKIILPALRKIMTKPHHELACMNACEALSGLSAASTDHIQAIVKAALCPRIVSLLDRTCLAVIEKLFKHSDEQIKAELHQNALEVFRRILTHRRTVSNLLSIQCRHVLPAMLKKICQVISVLTSGSSDEIQMVMDAELIQPLLGLVEDLEIVVNNQFKLEAVKAIICSFRRASIEQLNTLWTEGVREMLYNNLACYDWRRRGWCMDGLLQILKRGEALDEYLGGIHQGLYVRTFRELDGFRRLRILQFLFPSLRQKVQLILNTYDPIP